MKRAFLHVTAFVLVTLVFSSCICLLVRAESEEVPPVAEFTYSPPLPYVLEEITFDASASFDVDDFIYSYTWNFGDGNETVVYSPQITHFYMDPGEYNVNLTVADSCLVKNSTVKPLFVRTSVLASFSYSPHDPHVNEFVAFDASNSSTTEGAIVSYAWRFGDGNESVLDTPFISHAYVEAREYTVVLNVTSSSGEWSVASEVVKVTVLPIVAPRAAFTWLPQVPEAGRIVEFNASDSTPDGGTIVIYAWDFGDDATLVVAEPIVTHVYQGFGNCTVVLNVTDSDGFSNSTTHPLIVVERPVADFIINPKEPRVCSVVAFNASISDPKGGQIVSYEWTFEGNSTPQFGVSVTYRFFRMGDHTVYLNVTDSENLWDVKNVTVKILPHIADLNEDGKVDILDLVIFARAYGSLPGSERWNPRADLDDNDKINILDGVVIARSYNMCLDPLDP